MLAHRVTTCDSSIGRLYRRRPFADDADRVALLLRRYQSLVEGRWLTTTTRRIELELSAETRKRVRGFAHTFSVQSQQGHLFHSGPWFQVPRDLRDEAAKVGLNPESQITLNAREREAYGAVRDAILSDPALEHLSKRDVEESLQRFTWNLHLAALKSGALKKDVTNEFLEELALPITRYTVTYPIENLKVPETGIDIGVVSIRRLTEEELEDWPTELHFGVAALKAGDTIATCEILAGSAQIAHDRAKRLVDEALDAIRISVSNFGFRIHDFQLRFRRMPCYFARSGRDDEVIRSSGSFNETQSPLELDAAVLAEFSAKSISRISLMFEPKLNCKLRADFSRAVRWMGKSIVADPPDDKIVALCTALECLLSEYSTGLKSVEICRRSIVLGELSGEGFIHPSTITSLYDLRSNVIHGAQFDVGTEDDYRTLFGLALDVLYQTADLVVSNPTITSKQKLFQVLDDPAKLRPLLEWSRNESPRRLKDLIRDIEERLGEESQGHKTP